VRVALRCSFVIRASLFLRHWVFRHSSFFPAALALLATYFASLGLAAGEDSPHLAAEPSLFPDGVLSWSELPALPPPVQQEHLGVAGTFAGTYSGSILVAGGVAFADATLVPGKTGTADWRDDIFVLRMSDSGDYQWLPDERLKLPRPMGYGAAVRTDGAWCASAVAMLSAAIKTCLC